MESRATLVVNGPIVPTVVETAAELLRRAGMTVSILTPEGGTLDPNATVLSLLPKHVRIRQAEIATEELARLGITTVASLAHIRFRELIRVDLSSEDGPWSVCSAVLQLMVKYGIACKDTIPAESLVTSIDMLNDSPNATRNERRAYLWLLRRHVHWLELFRYIQKQDLEFAFGIGEHGFGILTTLLIRRRIW